MFLTIRFFSVLQNVAPAAALAPFLAPLSDPIFDSEKAASPNVKKIMESIRFLLIKSYTFLAPLSDPVFGAEKAPEPKREENHGIDLFFVLQSYTFLAPLSDPIFGYENVPGPKREENHGIDMFFVITTLYIPGTPLASDFWLRNGSGAQTEGQSWSR